MQDRGGGWQILTECWAIIRSLSMSVCQGDLFQCELPDLPDARYSHTQDNLTGIYHLPSFLLCWYTQPLIGQSHYKFSNDSFNNVPACGGYTREDCITLDPLLGLWRSDKVSLRSDLTISTSHWSDLRILSSHWLIRLTPGLQCDLSGADPSLLPRVLGQRSGEADINTLSWVLSSFYLMIFWVRLLQTFIIDSTL